MFPCKAVFIIKPHPASLQHCPFGRAQTIIQCFNYIFISQGIVLHFNKLPFIPAKTGPLAKEIPASPFRIFSISPVCLLNEITVVPDEIINRLSFSVADILSLLVFTSLEIKLFRSGYIPRPCIYLSSILDQLQSDIRRHKISRLMGD